MKIQKSSNNTTERLILTGMIVDPIVCGRITSKWTGNLFRSKYANLIASWCVQYYTKYGKAPGKQVEGLYRSWSEKTTDKGTVALVEEFLTGLSDEYVGLKKESNSAYILDKTGEYFSQIRIERLKDDLESDLTTNNVEKALERIQTFDQVKIGAGESINVFNAKEQYKAAFAEEPDGIVKYPGLLGQFFGNQFGRDMFVGFMGPEGRGKSFLLMDIAFRAALQRRKVAFFEAGDMSQNQILRRLGTRISNRPIAPGVINYPLAIRQLKTGEFIVDTQERVFKQPLDWREVLKCCKRLRRKKIRSEENYFRLTCHPNSTLHVKHIETALKEWAREGWVADVVVIDYSDILDMNYPKIEGRDRIDRTWRDLRRISQQFHCLVVTATQTNRDSYDAKIITRKHSSEDKRKLAHVTGMIGINQTEEEKKQEVMRFNWIKVRDGKYFESKCVAVAGCLSVGNVAIRSFM